MNNLHRVKIAGLVLLLMSFAGPASAQIDLSGIWAPIFHEDQVERIPGPDAGDYAGLPINDELRMRADSWDASLLTLPEHQCKPHPSTYGFRGVGNLRIWSDVDPTTQQMLRISTHIQWQEQHRDIWMDGRPHPPEYAAHTWQGFSTGRWEGETLIVTTTHLKAGWIRRNGLVLSDRATMEDFLRFTVRMGETVREMNRARKTRDEIRAVLEKEFGWSGFVTGLGLDGIIAEMQ